MTPYLPEELQLAAANVDDPTALVHLIASTLRLKTEERQELLETATSRSGCARIAQILSREVEMSELGSKIQSQVASEIDKGQREFFLRQQLKAIQEELGEGDEHQAEINELREQIEQKHLPEHVAEGGDAGAGAGSSGCRRRRPSTASSAPTSTGSSRCRGTSRPRTTSTSTTPAGSSTRTTSTSRR